MFAEWMDRGRDEGWEGKMDDLKVGGRMRGEWMEGHTGRGWREAWMNG